MAKEQSDQVLGHVQSLARIVAHFEKQSIELYNDSAKIKGTRKLH